MLLTLRNSFFGKHKELWSNLFVLLITCAGTGIWSIYAGQDINWDLKNYHFYNPWAFLHDKMRIDYAPAMIQSYHNPLLDLPIFLLMNSLKPIYVGFILGAIQGLNVFFVYLILKKVVTGYSDFNKNLLLIAGCCMSCYGAANLAEIGSVFGDNLVSVFILWALYLFLKSTIDRTEPIRIFSVNYILAGFIVGFAVGLKLTVAIYPIAIGISLCWLAKNFIDYLRLAIIFSLSSCIGLAASLGYWMNVLWKTYGNPFFPYFNKVFQSPYYQSINYTDNRFLPDDIYQTLFYPFYFLKLQNYTSELFFREDRFAICYLLLILFLAYILYKKINKEEVFKQDKKILSFNLFATSFFVISYILWQNIYSIQRYIVVLEFVTPIILLFFLNSFQLKKRLSGYLFVTLSIAIIFRAVPMDYGRMKWEDSYFDIQVPEIDGLENANVLMQGDEPLSYVIPYFPVETRFLKLVLKEPSPVYGKSKTQYDIEVESVIRKSKNNYILRYNNDKSEIEEIEQFYNLKMDSSSCKKINSKLNDNLCICKLVSQH